MSEYNEAARIWNPVQSLPYQEDDFPWMNFAFVHQGIAYVGYNFINSKELILLSYNIAANELSEISSVQVPNPDLRLLRHLFTIKDLAYFIEAGYSVIGADFSEVASPGERLYIYNLQFGDWKVSQHTYPNTFYGITSFGLNNRGFAGLGQEEASPVFSYPQDFFEFVPQ